ncbi:alpha/beta hydrolase [Arenimonas fontis]|uniref:Alpha/beta hydrolase n=1 Tax=Arenimonas fontis TaxID=2608255 RepID=A0A5B2ZAC1_9GAMM|nr:alpha/beta fold hydrolase [Arenimonas fontis]KAA2284102.1 alpha/beta hydrolase [Arenimonas fontis]
MDALPAFPTESGSLYLPGPAGRLELMVDLPEEDTGRAGVAIVCHPNPPDGGTLHNKVVTMTARALSELGIPAVRFNFRGVGQSEGSFDNGRGEVLDLLAVAAWAQKQRPGDALWLAGFSFGSWVALKAARQLPVKQMISIAPPVGLRDFTGVLPPDCPWLVIVPEADEVVDPQGVYDWIEGLDPKPALVRMPDTSHFFHRRLMDLRGAIKNGVRKNLPPPRND